jgi:ribosome biogenesis protein BRX1
MPRNRKDTLLVCATRGLKVQHRHLLRDLQRLLPHGRPSAKLGTNDGLTAAATLCEDADADSALLLDARDPHRLFMWAAGCPDGPSAMFRVHNVHTVAELQFEARRCAGVRNLLAFDKGFGASAELRVLRALLTRVFAVPRAAVAEQAAGVRRIKHTLTFSLVDGRIWVRCFRIEEESRPGLGLDVAEIGPRFVLQPVRIIAGGFGGAIIATSAHRGEVAELDD